MVKKLQWEGKFWGGKPTVATVSPSFTVWLAAMGNGAELALECLIEVSEPFE